MLHRVLLGLALGLLVATTVSFTAPDPDPFDLLIVGGRVVDGSGNPWFYGDVGVRDGRIVAVGRLAGHPAARTVDAGGMLVMPGFIDIHSHADDALAQYSGLRNADPKRRAAPNLVMQGITTVVVNQDGRSPWPIREQAATLTQSGVGPNVALMVGHGTVRRKVMGDDYRRAATTDEVVAMRSLVRQGMEEGAFGLSAGLEYVPGRWSTTDEVVALTEEVVPFGGLYIAHQRSEGGDPMWYWPTRDTLGAPTLIDAVLETVAIGERTGATVVASHLKAKGAHYWGMSHAIISIIEQARARGVSVWGDQYPYNTSGTDGNTVLLPDWALAVDRWGNESDEEVDYAAQLRTVLSDPARVALLHTDVAHEIRRRGGAGEILVLDHPVDAFVGRRLAELAAARDVSPVDMAIALQLEGDPARRGGGRLRGFSMSERDVETYATRDWMATITDGGIALPGDRAVHPRFYGAFPRKIARYARDREVLTVPQAVRSATSLPAQILGLRDRGLLREGHHADLVVLDLDRLQDTATFFEPHQYPAGIDYVFVGGTAVVEGGAPTYALPGRLLTPASAGARGTPQADEGR